MPVVAQFARDNRRSGRRPVGRVAETILRQVWALHLRRSGFEDLETTGNPYGPLSNRGQPSHVGDGSRFFQRDAGRSAFKGYNPEIDETDYIGNRMHREALRKSMAIDVELTAEYYRRIEHLAARFEDELDQQIALALSDGIGVRRIKERLRVGQGRVERVSKQLRIWMREKAEDEHGEE